MVDFGQVGTASLWKSGPLFSTGTKEAELMHKGLRVNPRSSGGRTWSRCPGGAAAAGGIRVSVGLSTGFAERPGLRSTGRCGPISGPWIGMAKEEVG